MERSFLQTPEWLMFQKSLGRRVWRLDDGFIKANVIRHDVRFEQNYLYIPHGPELNLEIGEGIRNEVRHLTRALRGLAEQNGSMFIKMEPLHDAVPELLYRSGMRIRPSRRRIQPNRTIVVDLTQSDDDLLSNLHYKTRYNMNLAERRGVTMTESRDVGIFWNLLQKTSEHDDFRTHPRSYYESLLKFFAPGSGPIHTKLYIAWLSGEPIAGVLMLEYDRTVYYLHGAMDRAHRAVMAPHLMHWRLMREYKRAGAMAYDFWGIDADRWPGVTRFKKGFGGREIEYPGTFDFTIRPFWHMLYRAFR